MNVVSAGTDMRVPMAGKATPSIPSLDPAILRPLPEELAVKETLPACCYYRSQPSQFHTYQDEIRLSAVQSRSNGLDIMVTR